MNPAEKRVLCIISKKLRTVNPDKISLYQYLMHSQVQKAAEQFVEKISTPRPQCSPVPLHRTISLCGNDDALPRRSITLEDSNPATPSVAAFHSVDSVEEPEQISSPPNIWFSSVLFTKIVKKTIDEQVKIRPRPVFRS